MDETQDAPDTFPRGVLPPANEVVELDEHDHEHSTGLGYWSLLCLVVTIVICLFGWAYR